MRKTDRGVARLAQIPGGWKVLVRVTIVPVPAAIPAPLVVALRAGHVPVDLTSQSRGDTAPNSGFNRLLATAVFFNAHTAFGAGLAVQQRPETAFL